MADPIIQPGEDLTKPIKLLSEQHSRTLFVFSEGECESVVADLTHLYLNDTPIKNANGSLNFVKEDFEIQTRTGVKNQTVMAGFQNSEKEIPVGVEVKKDKPVVRTVTDPNVKKVRITLGVKGLYYQPETKPETWGSFVYFVVIVGSKTQVVEFKGLSREQYLQQVEFDVSAEPVPFNIKVKRNDEDNTSSRTQNDTFWASYTEIIPSNLNYPNTALLGLQLNSRSFSNYPRVNSLMRGIRVHIPSNYNPYSRTYSGLWDGQFKRGWTNNPAWIYYDLVMNPRYGLGKRMWTFGCDKWALYAIARYCDEIVPDGFGGSEPRFTCNVAIQDQRQAYNLLNDLASAFRGIAVWDGTQLGAVQDRPADPVWIYTNANVVNGEFSYASAGLKARHNALHVEYLDKNDHYRKKTEYVADDQMIVRYGLNVKKVVAFGCTSRGQAYRTGRWILETEKLESKTVTFSVGLEGLKHVPSDIIEIADENYAGTKIGGRVLAVNGLTLELDREVEYSAGAFLRIHAKDGQIRKVNIIAAEGKTVTLANAVEVEPMSVWTYHGKIKPRLFRCLSVEEKDGTYTITALQHEPQKERIVDTGANFERAEYTVFQAPKLTHLTINSLPGGGLSISWNSTAAAGKVTYEVKVMKDGRIYAIYKNLNSLDLALQDLPNGEYTIIISIIGERGQILDQKQDVFVVDRPPVPEEVTISGGLTDITLNWKFVDKYTHTEIWAHTADTQEEALMVGKVFGSSFTHNIGAEQVRYYWVRHTRGQNVGYFHQERGLRGETAVDIDKELDVLNKKLSQNIVDQVIDTALPARNLEPVKTVSGLNVNEFQGSNLVYNTRDGQLYKWNGTKYVYKTPASNIDGIIPANQIAAIPTTKLTGQLTDAQISGVNANKIAGIISANQIAAIPTTKLSGTISAHQLSVNSVGANAIQAGAVGTQALAANSINATKMQANSIGVNHLQAGAVNADKLAANAMRAGHIAAGAIRTNHLAAGEITADKLAIGLGGNLLLNPIFANNAHGWIAQASFNQSAFAAAGITPYIEYRQETTSPFNINNQRQENENLLILQTRGGNKAGFTRLQNGKYRADACRQLVRLIPDKTYMLSFYGMAHWCGGRAFIEKYDAGGEKYVSTIAMTEMFSSYSSFKNDNGTFANGGFATATRHFVKFTAPDTGYVQIIFSITEWDTTGGSNLQNLFIARPMLEECTPYATAPSVWQNAGVTAIHGGSLVTETVTAQKLAADSVTANKIAAGAVAAKHIAAGSINANHIQTKSLNADKFNVQKLSAISADLGDIRAGSININGRFIVGNDGRVEIRNQNANVGMIINNDNICVYDAAGRLRVKMGRL